MKKISLILALIILAAGITACTTTPEAAEPTDIDQTDTTQTEDTYKSVTISHELGETKIENKPERVIVFDYGILDTMDIIGEDVIGLPKKTLPPYLEKYRDEKYEDVGTLQEPNFELIYELQPDLIIISTRQAGHYEDLSKIAPTVYLNIDGGDYINSFKRNMKALGEIFANEDLLATKVEEIEGKIKELNEIASTSDKTALFIMANDGNLSAYGPGSRFGILHKEFGVKPVDENIESSTHGQKITFEYIVDKNPDYLFVMDRATIAGGDTTAEQVMDNDLIKSTDAYKNGNIIYLDPYIWYVSSGGLTGTTTMVEEIQSAITK